MPADKETVLLALRSIQGALDSLDASTKGALPFKLRFAFSMISTSLATYILELENRK